MNFGLVSAALANKIALMNLDRLAERIGVRIHPILGMGSAPFRGGLSPRTAERVGREYPSVVTFTIQSAFKFDYPVDEVRAACEHLKSRVIGHAAPIDVERAQSIMERYSKVYRRSIAELAPHINRMAKHVPARRARKLHVGLFGYARELDGITLPRAISFTCSLYALGLPPELIAFDALSDDDLSFIHDAYPSFRAKIEEALKFADLEGPLMTDSLREALGRFVGEPQTHEEHLSVVRRIRNDLESGNTQQIGNHILSTALMRRFLG